MLLTVARSMIGIKKGSDKMTDSTKTVLFDLDGTIIDSEEGITNCIRNVLDYWKMEQPPQKDLLQFIGPPLKEQFQIVYGFDEIKAGVSDMKFRERFDRKGIFECALYPGITDTLHQLKLRGYRIMLASSKHEEACVRIIEHFHLTHCFDGIFGAEGIGKGSSKECVLNRLFHETGIDLADAVLIGDTKYDVLGAKAVGISCIGAAYGFGSREELETAGAWSICNSTAEIESCLDSFFKMEGDNYESIGNKRQRKKRREHSNPYQYCV